MPLVLPLRVLPAKKASKFVCTGVIPGMACVRSSLIAKARPADAADVVVVSSQKGRNHGKDHQTPVPKHRKSDMPISAAMANFHPAQRGFQNLPLRYGSGWRRLPLYKHTYHCECTSALRHQQRSIVCSFILVEVAYLHTTQPTYYYVLLLQRIPEWPTLH